MDSATFYRWETGAVPDLMLSTYRRVQDVIAFYRAIPKARTDATVMDETVLPLRRRGL